jgi:hypothetical protein
MHHNSNINISRYIFNWCLNQLSKRAMIVFFLNICILSVHAQDKENSSRDRLFFGGSFGLQFGTITRVEVSPLVGYRITPRLSSGIGITYEYYNDKTFDIETSIYGGRIFSNYLIIKDFNEILPGIINGGLFAQAEYEALSLETKHFDNLNIHRGQERFLLHNVLVGGGLRFPLGERASANLLILWNLNETSNTPYSNPVIRLGFNF